MSKNFVIKGFTGMKFIDPNTDLEMQDLRDK